MNLLRFVRQPLAFSLLLLPLHAGDIHVFAAASLTDALKEIAPAFEKSSGEKLVFNFAASSVLARQIQEGAPADLFFSADEAKMDGLAQKDLIQKESRKSLLSNTLVIVAVADSKLALKSGKDLADETIKSIALGEPNTVPAGVYAKEYLQKIGIWPAVEKKIIPTENVRAALAAVESGNADTGIVYKTDALISKKIRVVLEIAAGEGPAISYPLAIPKAAPHSEAAKKLSAWLQTPEALKIFEKYGFLVRP
jgi:molybdate transport system substrate-binding protein